ncbi:Sec1-like protein [Baffinella frigidus]|nr:Sec1-like protein [Cryptophyta sp. CCMP2293]
MDRQKVLLLLDRSTDLSVNLQHAWTYEALLHDVLCLRLNKVTVVDPDAGAQPVNPSKAELDVLGLRLNNVTVVDPDAGAQAAAKRAKVYDLGGNDAFWVDNCGQPFPKGNHARFWS